jgi:hypothetical protein
VGRLSEKDALYLPITPGRNDGTTVYKLTVRDVPVAGLWSLTDQRTGGISAHHLEHQALLRRPARSSSMSIPILLAEPERLFT